MKKTYLSPRKGLKKKSPQAEDPWGPRVGTEQLMGAAPPSQLLPPRLTFTPPHSNPPPKA